MYWPGFDGKSSQQEEADAATSSRVLTELALATVRQTRPSHISWIPREGTLLASLPASGLRARRHDAGRRGRVQGMRSSSRRPDRKLVASCVTAPCSSLVLVHSAPH